MSAVPRRLQDLAVSETGFVFDPHSGATFSTNASGLTILRALKDGADRAGIRARLEETFETGGADLERDLDEFFHLLRRHALLPEPADDEASPGAAASPMSP